MKKSALILSVLAAFNAFSTPDIYVYTGAFTNQFRVLMGHKGKLMVKNGEKEFVYAPKKAKKLYEYLRYTSDFFYGEFNYDSWDNKGSDIHATYNVSKTALFDFLGLRQNAAWAKDRFLFGSGKRKGLDDMEKALDVVAHEYTHAVIDGTSKLKYEGQSGALNEHFCDVFGSIVNQMKNPGLENPYLIGKSILKGEYIDKHSALRDMMDPSRGISEQPSHMSQIQTDAKFKKYGKSCVASSSNDKCGVHILSGIPNKAAALVMSQIGPEDSAKLYYNVMTKLNSNADFSDYRRMMLKECKEFSEQTCFYVDEALKSVGLED